jgi:excisionase family DNA binding protein
LFKQGELMTTANIESNPVRALRVTDACAVLSISKSKLYLEVAAGRLRAVKCGSRTLIPAEAADAWLRSLPPLHEAAKAA